MAEKIKVTVWNEFRHEKTKEDVKKLYPDGLHAVIRDCLNETGKMDVTLAALDDPDQGIPDEVLENTDVLIWWGHMAHKEVSDELVKKIVKRVYLGKMGFIALHSGHKSKPFQAIVGTNGNLQWGRCQKEVLWNMSPGHPIAAGIPDHVLIESEEMYSEPFFIPQPDELVFGAWFEDGNIFRSGCVFHRGAGRIFYFQPGHETCKSYFNPYIRRIIQNAVFYVNPTEHGYEILDKCPHITTPIRTEFDTDQNT